MKAGSIKVIGKMANTIIVAILIVAALNVWMYLQQPAMIFFPVDEFYQTPPDWGLDYEDVSLTTSDGLRLHGWYLPHQDSNKVLLFFHGNAGNISHRGESLAVFHELGLNVLIIDYRGYGRSQGSPSENGVYRDARAAWDYLRQSKGFASTHIILFGRSLGGAVATRLAANVQPGALILESTFGSARDMAAAVFPLLHRLIFLRFRFNSAQVIKRVESPLLVLHSPDDDIIPYRQGRRVFEAANEPKRFVKMRGDHNSGFVQSQPAYKSELNEFIVKSIP